MAYIGKQPTVGNFVKLDAITTSATTTFNLTNGGVAYSPQSANHCIVSLNGVIQSPGTSFTISGSTIVFASALTSSDVIDFILVLGDVLNIGTPSDATVTNAKLALTAGSSSAPTISIAADTNTGMFFPAADTIAFTEGGTESMRINSSGNVLVGTTSAVTNSLVNINGGINSVSGLIGRALNDTFTLNTQTQPNFGANFSGSSGVPSGISGYYGLAFATDGAERMRIDSSGNLCFAGTNADPADANVNGITLMTANIISATRTGGFALDINRKTSDGTLVNFRQDGITEGTISVAGNTVSYNGFTGSHWSRFVDGSKPDVLRGTVLESLDQMTDWYQVEFTDNENNLQKKPYALKANEKEGDVITYAWKKKDEEGNDIIEQVQATIVKEVDVKHVMSKISDTVEAKNVYGVFHAWDNDDLINNDFYVASVGSFVVRIKAGQTVSKGDLLQSNGDGTAKVQADDIIRASTFAKVLSNTVIETYEDGSFIVPCSLMC